MSELILNENDVVYKETRRGGEIKVLVSKESLPSQYIVMGKGILHAGQENVMHIHDYSEEYFYITSGNGKVEIEGQVNDVKEGDIIQIPKSARHKLINCTEHDMEYLFISSPQAPTPQQGHRDIEEYKEK